LAAVIGVTGLAFEARIAADCYTHAICGGDGSKLAGSLASAIAGDCCGLISFGIAGGLSPDLPAGTCIVGSTIISETIQLTTDRSWSQALLRLIPDAIHGTIAGVNTIVAHPEAKRSLHVSTGALAVDNESHVAASVAAARGLPMDRCPRHGSSHTSAPRCRLGSGAFKRDDRSRRANPFDSETA
jgi:adenosylhomocysteine nucleosidase